MKSVLMIAYSFPPEGKAGALRPLRFVRHLAAEGWLANVITASTGQYERYDADLLKLVPREIDIVRVLHNHPWQAMLARRGQSIGKLLLKSSSGKVAKVVTTHSTPLRARIKDFIRTVEGWCYHPDMQMCWIRPARDATLRICARQQPNVIWATGPPWSSFLVAQQTSNLTGLPYILDFRTSWTIVTDDFERRRPAWAQRRDQHTLRDLLKKAQAVIFFYTVEAECFWRQYEGALDVHRIHIIPNGFDGEIEEFVEPDDDDGNFTILYSGTLLAYRYDTFLKAVHQFKKSEPVQAHRVRVLFVGEGADAVAEEANRLGLSDIVSSSQPKSHDQIMRLQRKAHALLMLERSSTIRGHELLAGAKLFGYLKAGRPILGVLPQGEAKRVLNDVGVCTVADVDSISDIVATLRTLLDAWNSKTLSRFVPNPTGCEIYSAKKQTAALVRALEGLSPLKLFTPGSAEIPPSLRGRIANSKPKQD